MEAPILTDTGEPKVSSLAWDRETEEKIRFIFIRILVFENIRFVMI